MGTVTPLTKTPFNRVAAPNSHSSLSIAMIGTRGLPATNGGVEMSVEGLPEPSFNADTR